MDLLKKMFIWLAPLALGTAVVVSAVTAPDDPETPPTAGATSTPTPSADAEWKNEQGTSALVPLRRSPPIAGWVRIDDPRGWSFRMPAYWKAIGIANHCGRRTSFEASLATHNEHEFRTREACPGATDLSKLPPDAVVVMVSRSEGGPLPKSHEGPLTEFPLDLSTFVGDGREVSQRVYLEAEDRSRWTVTVRIGATASDASMKIAERIVSSIEFTQ